MSLNTYLQDVQLILGDTIAAEYTTTQLTIYINIARAQVAADAECIRWPALVNTVAGQRAYRWALSTLLDEPSLHTGIQGVLLSRAISRTVITQTDPPYLPSPQVPLENRAWEWFNFYYVQQPIQVSTIPTRWSTLQRGVAGPFEGTGPNVGSGGVFYVDPVPDDTYNLLLDAVCLPISLVDDATIEMIPYPWTDSIKYYACYLAYLNTQRKTDAENMLAAYNMFAGRGTKMTTATQLPMNYPGGLGAQQASQKSLVGTPSPSGTRAR